MPALNPPIPLSPFDVLLPGLPVVFCGINPSPLAAQSGHNFGSASNRFWPALHRAGFTAERLRAAAAAAAGEEAAWPAAKGKT